MIGLSPAKMERMVKREAALISKIANELITNGTPMITALVMAGDYAAVQRVDDLVKSGERPINAVWMVGSYARFEWAIKNLSETELLSILPELWVSSDPDDTKPEYLALWERAFVAHGNRMITDGHRLPRGERYTVYRGQVGDADGISWTLDRSVAAKFAANGGGRQFVRGGKVLRREVNRTQILAYLTRRNESELIIKL